MAKFGDLKENFNSFFESSLRMQKRYISYGDHKKSWSCRAKKAITLFFSCTLDAMLTIRCADIEFVCELVNNWHNLRVG